MLRIALDAGHGIWTKGKETIQNPTMKEWQMNNLVATKVAEGLSWYAEVQTFRVDDIFGRHDISLPDRNKAAQDGAADLYLAIHHNADSVVNRGTGVEVYSSKDDKTQLGTLLSSNISYMTGLKDRGNKTKVDGNGNDWFYVLRETPMQAYLLEGGFMTNWADLEVISTEVGCQKYADAIVESLVEFYKLKPKFELVGKFDQKYPVVDLRLYNVEANREIYLKKSEK